MAVPDVLAAVEAALIEHFAQRPERASVSFVGVDPIEILRFEPVPGERAYLSLGMSRYPMTPAAEAVLAATGPRAELMLHLRDPTDDFGDVWRRLALLAAAPAVEGVVYTPGMSIDVGEALVPGSACTGALVEQSGLTAIVVDDQTTVPVLSVLPATSAELAWCRVRGSAELRSRWTDQGIDLMDLRRRSASLEQ